jgi:hypothetical protein
MPVVCYPSPGKRKALKLCTAFAAGCGGRVAEVGAGRLAPGAAFFYGMTARTLALLDRCRREGRDWYYADNAYYVGRGSHFRVTRNALQHDGTGTASPERWRAFGIEIRPWRRGGRHILVTTQSELFYRLHLGLSRADWLAHTLARLECATERPIRVCHKPGHGTPGNAAAGAGFEAALAGAHALVTHSSSTAVKALLEGVPVFCTGPCAASPMGLDDLSRIEAPATPEDREPWLWTLAANQWTRQEMADGTCWRALRAQMTDDRHQVSEAPDPSFAF